MATERVVGRIGPRPALVLGLGVLGLALVLFARMPVDGSFLADVLVPSLLGAVGMSLAYIPAMITATAGRAPRGRRARVRPGQHHVPGRLGDRARRDGRGGRRQDRRAGERGCGRDRGAERWLRGGVHRRGGDRVRRGGGSGAGDPRASHDPGRGTSDGGHPAPVGRVSRRARVRLGGGAP
jgi:hypothetical protein